MTTIAFEQEITKLGEQHKYGQLQKLLANTSTKQIVNLLKVKLGRNECITLWHYLLMGFPANSYEAKEKRFACVKCVLDGLLKTELSFKYTYDIITRLCQDLNTFSNEQLIEILEHCMDGIRAGDPKCVGWKDLLPETLNILSTMLELNVNGITMSGLEYRNNVVRNLCTMRWTADVLTPLADMFRNLKLTPAEILTVLNKFAGSLQSLSPTALPALSYQLFSLSKTAAHIIIPILALERYFHRFYYKQLFADMNSNSTDFDSIDAFSDKELREAEETILHHLSYCTQYKINEMQMSLVLRNFTSMPDVILTPFVLSAILSMSAANRQPDNCLSSSILLPLLRKVIKHNEDERTLAEYSVWCRDSLQRKQVDLEQVFTVLIDQNKDGKDIVTPGLVNLAFVLLKTKHNSQLHHLAIGFLIKFIRKRFIFGQGIVKKVAEMMVIEQEHNQFSECLTLLSVADTFTVSECINTIKCVMDKFLWLPGDQSLRMMSFILPILKISPLIRDALIEVLRKAITNCDLKICRMAVYGFCMILKQLNNSNSQRSQISAAGMCTQQCITGYSVMSQATLGLRANPQRHFDMLTLEIIGILRVCFHSPVEVKITLYENLQRAVELNPKLVPHILQFIDWHFRGFFQATPSPPEQVDASQSTFHVKFEQVVYATDDQYCVVHVQDNLGCLLLFLSHCLVIFEKFTFDYNVREMKRLIETSLEKITNKELKLDEVTGSLTLLKSELMAQQLNFLEGLMAYCVLTSQPTNDHVKYITGLYKQHEQLAESLKTAAMKKSSKKAKGHNDTTDPGQPHLMVNGVAVKKINSQFINIWDLLVLERLLRLLHEDVVHFASASQTSPLRSNKAFVRYVLEVTATKVESIRLEPIYKQLSHSKRTLKYLTDLTKVVYERCIKRLPTLWQKFDLKAAALATETFRQCLQTANVTYKAQFSDIFLKGFDVFLLDKSKECTLLVQDVIETFMQEEFSNDSTESLLSEVDGRKIALNLFSCLEILYDNISFGNRMTIESYSWLMKFCQAYPIQTKELGVVHKLLFKQRQKTHSGAFFQIIPKQLAKLWSYVRDEVVPEEEEQMATQSQVELKSFTEGTAESSLHHLYESLSKQITDVDYFITKANNLSYKCCIVAEEERDFHSASLRSLERSICSQLVHISQTLKHLTNVCIPLGSCMDGLMRLLMLHYICLKNLAKHYLQSCSGGVKVSLQGTKFDLLLREVGKPLPSNIYALITYIESNILEESTKKKTNPQADKAKVLKETKYIPKIILCIENFNKHVIMLAKKTNDRLANFLHFGTVRDFRLKTNDLKAAIERTLSHSSQIEEIDLPTGEEDQVNDEEESILQQMMTEAEQLTNNNHENEQENQKEEEDVHTTTPKTSRPKSKKTTNNAKKGKTKETKTPLVEILADSDEERTVTPDTLNNESEKVNESQLRRNVAKINKLAKKRTLKESEPHDDPDVASAPPLEPPKKKARATRVRK